MDVSEDVAGTLRAQDHGHPPAILAAGFCTEHSARARSIGYEEETSPTLRAGTVPAAVYENHGQDTRFTGPVDTAPTVVSSYGTGGNNQPFVVETPKTLKIRCGCEGGGKGPLIQDDKSATLSCNNDQTLFVPFVKGTRPHSAEEGQQWKVSDVANTLTAYDIGEQRCNELAVKVFGICSKDSNAMKSDNPKSGFYEANTTRTLDGNGGNPVCNQGGMAVVAIEGNGARPSHQGRGYSEEEVSFTLNATEQHGVAHPVYSTSKSSFHLTPEENLVNTLVATDYKDPPTVYEDPYFIVRRLTPTECARLQGFPDWWCAGLETDEPTREDIEFWRGVFETHRRVTGIGKPKSDEQIVRWLKNPHSDSAEYKLWGNGVALTCVCFVLAGIVYYARTSS
jgi:DNA (cytosine-5)-methyltransferase 1